METLKKKKLSGPSIVGKMKDAKKHLQIPLKHGILIWTDDINPTKEQIAAFQELTELLLPNPERAAKAIRKILKKVCKKEIETGAPFDDPEHFNPDTAKEFNE